MWNEFWSHSVGRTFIRKIKSHKSSYKHSFRWWQKSNETLSDENQPLVLNEIGFKFQFRKLSIRYLSRNWSFFHMKNIQTEVFAYWTTFYKWKVADWGNDGRIQFSRFLGKQLRKLKIFIAIHLIGTAQRMKKLFLEKC